MMLIYKEYPAGRGSVGIESQDFQRPVEGARLLRVEMERSSSADFPFKFVTIWIVGE